MQSSFKAGFLAILISTSMLAGCFGSDEESKIIVEEDPFFTFKEQLGNNTWYHYPGGINAMNNTSALGGNNIPFLSAGSYYGIGMSTFEPTMGITSTGNLYMASHGNGPAGSTAVVQCSGLTTMTADNLDYTCQNVYGPFLPVANSNDPYIYVDPWTDRIMKFDMHALLGMTVETSDDPNRSCPMLRDILPASANQPYDMKKVIKEVVDDGEFFEYFEHWAKSIVCGFSRVDGMTVGVVGNQPMAFAGVLDIESSEKAARFVRTCDAFNIPLLTFVDVPGFLPGVNQEHEGIIRHGAKLLYAFCEATVPRIQIITRKAYGGAYVVMNSKSIGADLAYAWPTAELAVMGPQGAVEIVYKRELQQAADPVARRAELVAEYTEKYANPYAAAERGYVDDVIDPADTRIKIIAGLRMLQTKREELPRRKHGNMPL